MRTAIYTLPHLLAEKQRKQNQTVYLFHEPQNLRPCIIQIFGSLQFPTLSHQPNDLSLAAAVAMAPFDSGFDPWQRRHLIRA